MHNVLEFFAAIGVGLFTADMFVRSWSGVLELLASAVLFHRKKITLKSLFLRLNRLIPLTILFGLALILCFKIYFSVLGLGRAELEQLGYFLGVLPRTGLYLVRAGRMIDAMFKP